MAGTCVIEGCGKPHNAKGYCMGHYRAARRGDLDSYKGLRPLEERLWERIVEGEGGCWLWTGATSSAGYGQIGLGQVNLYTHRVVYELLVVDIPEGLELDHTCRVRNCCNPAHLDPVTSSVNKSRVGSRKQACPQGHPYAGDNLVTERDGSRKCRICCNARRRIRREAVSA
jgi:hypothetical protein